MLHHETHHCPQCAVHLFTITLEAPLAPVQLNEIQDFAEYIQLLLTHPAVPNAHRTRITVPIDISNRTLQPCTPAVQRMRQLPVEVALVQLTLGQPACSSGLAPNTYSEQQALAFL